MTTPALRKTLAALLAGVLVFAASACGLSTTQSVGPGIITISGSEPQNPLYPANSNEVGGGDVITQVFTQLVGLTSEGEPELEVAESIEANENSTQFDITMKQGWTFHNGEKVTANSFIDAWNFGANAKNGQVGSDGFRYIQGFQEVSSLENDVSRLSGLTKIDDYHFTVTMSEPFASFPIQLADKVYSPLPKAAFEDTKAFGEHPIGNGPYKMADKDGWVHNAQINLVSNPNYAGKHKPKNKGVSFIFYNTMDAAYVDALAGNLDIAKVPNSSRGNYTLDFPNSSLQRVYAAEDDFVIPFYLDHFGNDEEGNLRRQAISLAMDRDLIQTAVKFVDEPQSSKDFTIKIGDQPIPDIPGNEVLSYNPDKARELWNQADKISPWSGVFEIAYNNDGDHAGWVEATTNMISQNLGIQAQGKSYPLFKALRDDISGKTVNAAYRSSGVANIPMRSDFLESYISTEPRNYTGYSNPNYDALYHQAMAAANQEQADLLLDEAQAILMRDLPAIPQWYATAFRVWNPALENVVINWRDFPELTEIVKDDNA